RVAKQTLIIDGDRDHFFLAVDGGTLRVGDDPARPGVVRGLRVVRIRCEVEGEGDSEGVRVDGAEDEGTPPRPLAPGAALEVGGDGVTVTPVEGPHGTLIDGRRIEKPEVLRPGSVLRVGNSHLRLEAGVFPDEPPPAAGPGSGVLRAGTGPRPSNGEPLAHLE